MEMANIKRQQFNFKNYLEPIYEYNNNDYTNIVGEMFEPVLCRKFVDISW
jgi:hypothetical protein